ncbi:hypothetical protein Taro_024805 [Colocasia esculenta]|uniref:Uncharacterized protein n=1 Tax=Colocasia esculenta TaxID=4460 RepID=A0A843V8G8_COLES|nr:hypothetical protein [Colocasia esculenta]
MQGLVQAMQTQAHTQAALQAQLEAQEGEMEKYLEEKKASQKRPTTTFQRQDKKKAVYQTQQRSVAVGSTQRLQDQGLSETSAGNPVRSASPSTGSGSSASYRKTRKASSPSSSASSGDPLLLGGSLDLGKGFPNTGLKLASTENQEEGTFGGFLGLPKESFNSNLDSFGDFPRVLDPHIPLLFGARFVFLHRQELGVKALAAKISSMRPAILPSNSLNGQTLPPSSSVPNSLVGDTPLEETVESDSERGE